MTVRPLRSAAPGRMKLVSSFGFSKSPRHSHSGQAFGPEVRVWRVQHSNASVGVRVSALQSIVSSQIQSSVRDRQRRQFSPCAIYVSVVVVKRGEEEERYVISCSCETSEN